MSNDFAADRRELLKNAAVGVAGLAAACAVSAEPPTSPTIFMDGHVHVIDRVFWEGIDPWKPQPVGSIDYARARQGGVNVVIDNVAAYGYEDYNGTVKQVGRMIETFYRVLDANHDKMDLALTSADVRRIVGKGKFAVLLGIESGFDQDGDIDMLHMWHRLGVRCIQFTSYAGNAYADAASASGSGDIEHWGGINDRGRKLIAEMNRLGILIDISHATESSMRQIVEASRAPIVGSHMGLLSVANRKGINMPDDVAVAIAKKGGLIGVTSVANATTQRYLDWQRSRPAGRPAPSGMAGISLGNEPAPLNVPGWVRKRSPDYGAYSEALYTVMKRRWIDMWSEPWRDDPEAPIPTVEDWADHVQHAVTLMGADHVGIGLDLFQGRSHTKDWDATGYHLLAEALQRRNIPKSVLGENWMRVLDTAKIA